MPVEELQNGRYRRVRLLGSGGMGEVYLMNDTRVSRLVAIKVLRAEVDPYPDSDVSKDAARLFQREARAIAALEHSNILPLYDFGEEKFEGNNITYMVMPFCPDGSLVDWLRQRKDPQSPSPLSPPEVAHLISQAADALQYAHDHQMIHLDVKPSNFLLRANQKNPNRPTLLLADFGIARSSSTTSSSSRTIRGTPTAMAPEHWTSKPMAASDQYSLAVMAYELLTGRPPFIGSMEQLMYQHFSATPTAPSKLNPQLSAAVDQVLLRALAKKPEERYPSITAFASALEEALLQTVTPGQGSADASGSLSAAPTIFPSSIQAGTPSPANLVSALPTVEASQNRTPQLSDVVSALPTVAAPQNSVSQPSAHFTEHDSPTVASQQVAGVTPRIVAQPLPSTDAVRKTRSGTRIFSIVGVVVLLVLIASGAFFGTRLYGGDQQANTAAALHSAQTATAQALATKSAPTATPTATPTPPGLYIAGSYSGSMFNSTTNQTTLITVFIRQTQGSGVLNGSVTFKTSSSTVDSLSGTVDKQGNFSFSVQQGQGKQPFVFYGSVQNSVYLHGNFCNSSTNTCDSNSGYFTVGPRS